MVVAGRNLKEIRSMEGMTPISAILLPAEGRKKIKHIVIGAPDNISDATSFYIIDISENSILGEGIIPLSTDENVVVEIFGYEKVNAKVNWINLNKYFISFINPISESTITALKRITSNKSSHKLESPSVSGSLGASLRRVRESRGVSQKTLAAKMGVSIPTISMWEGDHRRPSIERLAKICEILNASAEDLLAGVGSNELSHLLSQTREQIARFLGMTADRVRIFIEI